MATQIPTLVNTAGVDSTKVPADPAGDSFKPGRCTLTVENRGASPRTVSVTVPGLTKYGQPNPDVPIVVAAGAEAAIGPFPADLADPTTGRVEVTYSSAVDLWVALIELSRTGLPPAPSGYGLSLYGLGRYGA